MFDLVKTQQALTELNIDAWLLYDFRCSNALAGRILDLRPEQIGSRRFFYLVPAVGEPQKLVHRIESNALDHLPGKKTVYLKWQELESQVQSLLRHVKTVAMEYSPRNANPYVSRVDAGTIELIRSFQVDVVSSGDLVQRFEATLNHAQWQSHLEADQHTQSAFTRAWSYLAGEIRLNRQVRESDVQQQIMRHFQQHGMTTDHPPIVARGPNSGDPHYTPSENDDALISEGDLVLIDLWAKMNRPGAVYSDLTKIGFVGRSVPDRYNQIFRIVAAARDAAIESIRNAFAEGRTLYGWQVDQAARDVISAAGYGEYFVHRTGHSIGQETHGNGANMDNLETREERRVLKQTCFSVEPGIYLPDFGVRSEVNLWIDGNGNVHVTGGEPQASVLAIMAAF